MNKIILVLLSTFLLLNSTTISAQTGQPVPDGMPSYDEFEAQITKYPYIALPERKNKIKLGIQRLTKCMNKSSVEELLGQPDYSKQSYGPKGPNEKWLGSNWTYYVFKESELVNLNDTMIHVFFNIADRAHWIVSSNFEGVSNIGGVQEKCN